MKFEEVVSIHCLPLTYKIFFQNRHDKHKILHELFPECRSIILTGYASIATAVDAIKHGAVQYLVKPATPDEIITALLGETAENETRIPENPISTSSLARIQRQAHVRDLVMAADEAARSYLEKQLPNGLSHKLMIAAPEQSAGGVVVPVAITTL